jgi:hypothetical protein
MKGTSLASVCSPGLAATLKDLLITKYTEPKNTRLQYGCTGRFALRLPNLFSHDLALSEDSYYMQRPLNANVPMLRDPISSATLCLQKENEILAFLNNASRPDHQSPFLLCVPQIIEAAQCLAKMALKIRARFEPTLVATVQSWNSALFRPHSTASSFRLMGIAFDSHCTLSRYAYSFTCCTEPASKLGPDWCCGNEEEFF